MNHNMELVVVAQILSNQATIIELNKVIMTAIYGKEKDIYKKYYEQLDRASKMTSDMASTLLNMTDKNNGDVK